jgi:hypothetical protein
MILYIPHNSFWQVEKLHGFGKKILETLGDAFRRKREKYLPL